MGGGGLIFNFAAARPAQHLGPVEQQPLLTLPACVSARELLVLCFSRRSAAKQSLFSRQNKERQTASTDRPYVPTSLRAGSEDKTSAPPG